MELWIRSQDRECLMKVDRLDYDLSNYKHRIMVNGYQTLVAEYDTKKRALEVLNEIQSCLYANFNFTGTYEEIDAKLKAKMINGLYGYIYQMPEN